MSALKIEALSFSIAGLGILNDLSLEFQANETVGIIGPNGSGKTTLFNCLSGFNYPDAGKITLKDIDITELEPHERSKLGLGRVFQNSGVFRDMSLLDNMLIAIESRQTAMSTFFPWAAQHAANRAKALCMLSEVGLESRAQAKASSLSGGQMRLLEIMRTLAFGAELFLLDEPTAGVSPKMKDDVAGVITKLQEYKKTVLVIEHDINFIQKFCRRIVVLDQGRVILDDTPDNVRANKMLQEIYFGSSSAGK